MVFSLFNILGDKLIDDEELISLFISSVVILSSILAIACILETFILYLKKFNQSSAIYPMIMSYINLLNVNRSIPGLSVFIVLLFSFIFDKTNMKPTFDICCNSVDNHTNSKCNFINEQYECQSFEYFQAKIDNYLGFFYQFSTALCFIYTIFSVLVFIYYYIVFLFQTDI